jgi:purine nucleoside permease
LQTSSNYATAAIQQHSKAFIATSLIAAAQQQQQHQKKICMSTLHGQVNMWTESAAHYCLQCCEDNNSLCYLPHYHNILI